ncbi:MAG: TAT-variant-translocated molybdopterin oxidoreductase [Bacteroidota bacterium]|nr:TAT-variant-translocated molybdopterin oxidoreductase [Bacteroidota bacterium]
MMDKKYWQSFGELNNTEAFQQSAKDEFREELPFEADDKGLLEAKTPRRDFLKYLGFSTAAAAVAASCEVPVKKAIPFANKPEDIVPGVANYYATTYVQDGEAVSVLAKVRDGRPIKIEGNELSPITKGGTSARVQASVLDLYDTARLRFPTIDGKEVTFDAFDKAVSEAIGSGPAVILTSTIVSPSTKEVINQFIAKHPGSRQVTYDAVSYSGMLLANEATYGKRAIPSYRFDNAKVIVSLGADFLGTWLSPIEFAKQYSKGKKIDEKKPEMSKHIHFESVASLTGSNADEKFLHRPSETGAIAVALLNAINGQAVNISDAKLKAGVEKAAKALAANKGEALVVCGSNDVNVQIVVNAINEALQANGKTIDWSSTYNSFQGIDADFAKLVDDMNAGSVSTLLVYGANPVYTWYDSKKVVDGLKKVKNTISFNAKNDETTQLCKYVIPDHHYLESWGDAEPKTGYYSLLQPTIYPLFKTRQWQDSLLKWSGATTDYLAFLKGYWSTKVGGETGWDKALQDGVINPATLPAAAGATFNSSAVATAANNIASAKKGGKIELQLYQKVAIGGGQQASNPWLQELPDPITRATWDNYVIISPALARTLLNIDLNDNGQADAYEVNPPKKMVKVTVNGKSIVLPSLIIPGTHPDTIGIAVGYGRAKEIGKAVEGTGQNAYPLASLNGNVVSFTAADAQIEATGDTYKIAVTQTHGGYDTKQGKRTEVMKELTLSHFQAEPAEIREDREKELAPFGGLEKFEKEGTIYPYYEKPGIHWGMSVDLNTCTGCAACVVACHAENNVPVVGKPEVMRFHDMHWLRIDRYYSGDVDNPNVVFQPMMCQHCDNAPCENVCPVGATNHSSEGLNQMTYNRCIGTRYCANNCPYKVRRFNWADYTGADSFPDNQRDVLNDVVMNMNDDLTRMVLNPDVTVRSRGVIEKCSFCVQRLQEGKLKAKKESRPLKSGENNEWDVKTACQQACPTDAIVFGNANDKHSAITITREENKLRTFFSLEQLHVLPNVNYLAKVRNIEEGAEAKKEEKEHA